MTQTTKSNTEHWKITDFAGGLIGGSLLCVLGLWMILAPGARDHQPSERSVRLIGRLLDAIWSVPGGIATGLVGFAIFAMTLHQLVTQFNRR